MPGTLRRSKPLKAATDIQELRGVSISTPAPGDLLIYKSSGLWESGKALEGNYTLNGNLVLNNLSVAGDADFGGVILASGGVTAPGGVNTTSLIATSGEFVSLQATGASLLNTLALTGALVGTSFSFSQGGNIAGSLVTEDLSVTGLLDALQVAAGSLSVVGFTTLGSLLVSGEGTFGSSVSVTGPLSAGAVSSGTTVQAAQALLGNSLEVADAFRVDLWLDDPDEPTEVEVRGTVFDRSVPLVLRGTATTDPGDEDTPPTTEERVLTYLDPDGGVVLYYQGVPTFRVIEDDVEVWDGAAWGPVGVSELSALTDTDITAPADGHILRYVSGDWVNGAFPIELAIFAGGVPTDGEVLARIEVGRKFTIPSGASGSFASAGFASTGTATLDIKKNGASVGSVTFTTSATGTFTMASATTFDPDDLFELVAPGTADATLANISVTLVGARG
jgi:hypothetical protein